MTGVDDSGVDLGDVGSSGVAESLDSVSARAAWSGEVELFGGGVALKYRGLPRVSRIRDERFNRRMVFV